MYSTVSAAGVVAPMLAILDATYSELLFGGRRSQSLASQVESTAPQII